MNKKQKGVVIIVLALMAIMCVFPPWVKNGEIVSHVYFLFSTTNSYRSPIHNAHISFTHLKIQCAIVALIGGISFVTLKDTSVLKYLLMLAISFVLIFTIYAIYLYCITSNASSISPGAF